MKNKLVPVICDKCRWWKRGTVYTHHGECTKDGEVTKGHWACSKLPTDDDRRDAKRIQEDK